MAIFIATEALPKERVKLGYANLNDLDFVIKAYASETLHHYRFLSYRKTYMLCASAYTAIDHVQFGMYKNKLYNYKNLAITVFKRTGFPISYNAHIMCQ